MSNVNKIGSNDIYGGANTNLDEIFGDVRQPNPSTGGIKAFEQENGQIIRIPDLQVIESGQVVSPLQEGTRYLWLVDNNGRLRIAPDTANVPDGRLGHPNLVPETGTARVGGEIKFNKNTKRWRINDRSGRFSRGRPKEQRVEILQNVQKLFKEAGLDVDTKLA